MRGDGEVAMTGKFFWAAICILCAGLATGCASNERVHTGWTGPVFLPNQDATPHVVVYGNLDVMLPHFDVTPAIELFLYGPNDYGKTILRNPQGLTRASNQLLVCDQGWLNVVAIDVTTGKSVLWSDRKRPPRCPVDVAVAPSGWAYVADTTARAVLVYDAGGKFAAEITPSQDPHRAFRPASVLIVENTLYIGDLGSRSLLRWDLAAGKWLDPLAPPPRQPLIAPTGLALTPDGTLLIANSVLGVVSRYSRDGRWLAPLGRRGRGEGQFVRPKQICCTPSGLVLVTDAGRQSVLVFRADGRYVTELHEQAKGWKGFTLPAGITCVRAGDCPIFDEYVGTKGWPKSPEYVIVSDSLGGSSLTLLGVVATPAEGGSNAG